MQQDIAYGNLGETEEKSGFGIYGLIQYIVQMTTVSSMPSYDDKSVKKKETGLFVPGYLALILCVGTVIALALAVNLCVNYRKKSAVSCVGLFDIGFSSGDARSPERRSRKKRRKKDKAAKAEKLPVA
ncbi:unnamed protein product [Cylicostephanus goldi]|uniref:Uncharacterized protein n=1 Tax=Cylicostephanus goldi TaxID=71465 RepID=A0A3P6RZ58_CYLGO|nr:unnamed protein product [Cylicostephanus goldi]